MFAELEVTRGLSLRRIIDDSAFSKAQLKTLVYHPESPGGFAGIFPEADWIKPPITWTIRRVASVNRDAESRIVVDKFWSRDSNSRAVSLFVSQRISRMRSFAPTGAR